MSGLSDRLRTIVKASTLPAPGVVPSSAALPARYMDLEAALGGRWDPAATCFIVERRWESSARHGRHTIGELAALWHDAVCEAPLLAPGASRGPFVFFDLETTGLSGGAGTYAFVVGCGWFDGGEFVTRQYLLTRISDERPLLMKVADDLERAGALVSFNGKSFEIGRAHV